MTRWLSRRRLAVQQALCSHHVRVDLLRRVSPDLVECPCTRCGKVLQAPYGIALHAKWDPAPPVSEWKT